MEPTQNDSMVDSIKSCWEIKEYEDGCTIAIPGIQQVQSKLSQLAWNLIEMDLYNISSADYFLNSLPQNGKVGA